MNTLTTQDVEHIFEALRKGLVPERGIEAFAVGIDKQRGEIHRQLDLALSGEGTIKAKNDSDGTVEVDVVGANGWGHHVTGTVKVALPTGE